VIEVPSRVVADALLEVLEMVGLRLAQLAVVETMQMTGESSVTADRDVCSFDMPLHCRAIVASETNLVG
jgi:hypothetical protein